MKPRSSAAAWSSRSSRSDFVAGVARCRSVGRSRRARCGAGSLRFGQKHVAAHTRRALPIPTRVTCASTARSLVRSNPEARARLRNRPHGLRLSVSPSIARIHGDGKRRDAVVARCTPRRRGERTRGRHPRQPSASTVGWTIARTNCRAVNDSASQSRAHWWRIPPWSSPTNRPEISIRKAPIRCFR